ncbi:MAG: CotH kinase family protein [Flavobacteriales bacterium]
MSKRTVWMRVICAMAILTAVLLLAACEPEAKGYWYKASAPLSEWMCTKPAKQQDTTKVTLPYGTGSMWETTWTEMPLVPFSKICFLAPDKFLFELRLNGQPIVTNDAYTCWPASFDSVYLFPASMELRPYAIDTALFRKLLKADANKLSLRVKGKIESDFDATQCALFAYTTAQGQPPTALSGTQHPLGDVNLPLVTITADKYSIPNEPKVNALLGVQCSNNDCKEIKRSIRIEVRGFSSSSYDKKQYTFTTAGDSTSKEKIDLLGMGTARRWILQGPYSDVSLIRNAWVYEMWRRMGHWAPESRYVELVLNGNYQGVYMLMEKVEAGKSRLNLTVDTTYTSTFLVQLNRRKDGDDIIQDHGLMYILSDLPGMKKDDAYRNYVTQQLALMNDALEHPLLHEDVLDVATLTDYILLQEMVKNIDAYKVSTWFYKDDDAVDGRFICGPVWDFDLSVGNCNIARGEATDGFVHNTDNAIPHYFKNKWDDAPYKERMRARYKELRSALWNEEQLAQVMDSLTAAIGNEAIERNYMRFPVFGKEKFLNRTHMPTNHTAEVESMKTWMHQRLEWLDQYFDGTAIIRNYHNQLVSVPSHP